MLFAPGFSTHARGWYLITPPSANHGVYIDGGLDVAAWRNHPGVTSPAGKYQLSFTQDGALPSNGTLAPVNVCSGTVQQTDINNALTDARNFVIVLPYPSKFSTYLDEATHRWDGYSESEVNPANPTQPVDRSTLPVLVTTTMVLHYRMHNIVPASLTWNTTPSGVSSSIPTSGQGITIVATDPTPGPLPNKCDNVSLMSVNDRNTLSHISHHVLFPEVLDNSGHQAHHYYYDECIPSGSPISRVADKEKQPSRGDREEKVVFLQFSAAERAEVRAADLHLRYRRQLPVADDDIRGLVSQCGSGSAGLSDVQFPRLE